MEQKQIYFRPTTAQQRRLLFESWEESGNVSEACRKAHVSRRTFYNWKPRFEQAGYSGLEKPASSAPKEPNKKSEEIEKQVIEMREEYRSWGKRRIADELAKSNNWVPLVSPNTVRRILQEAGLWPEPEVSKKKKGTDSVARTAEAPGQTLNIDLCFVPASHGAEQKLPAVSGSSGRLVIEQPADEVGERDWPGRVFEDESQGYTEAMLKFVAASRAQERSSESPDSPERSQKGSLKAQKRALRQEEAQLRTERRIVRQQRQQEDAAWQKLKQEQPPTKAKQAHLSPQERLAHQQRWRVLRQQRREQQQERQTENQFWRQKRLAFRERWSTLPIVSAWIAILVVTDNCTRQCLGVPLFVAGPKVTAEVIVEALQVLLPPELLFLITDRGTHFRAKAFQELARSEEFIHVLIARHRPQSNGIAERFVRTLKEWLKDKSWHGDHQLATLLAQFRLHYNDRPHQGLPIPGLSPNEFEKRIWVM